MLCGNRRAPTPHSICQTCYGFYHAGRTLAAPSKAAMLATLLEEWHSLYGASDAEGSAEEGVCRLEGTA